MALLKGKEFPVRSFMADSCALDRYDIPIQREKNTLGSIYLKRDKEKGSVLTRK